MNIETDPSHWAAKESDMLLSVRTIWDLMWQGWSLITCYSSPALVLHFHLSSKCSSCSTTMLFLSHLLTMVWWLLLQAIHMGCGCPQVWRASKVTSSILATRRWQMVSMTCPSMHWHGCLQDSVCLFPSVPQCLCLILVAWIFKSPGHKTVLAIKPDFKVGGKKYCSLHCS